MTLLELIVTLGIVALVALMLVPLAASLRSAGRGEAAARELAMTFHAMRWRAVAARRTHGLFFDRDARGWRWHVVRDENGNGLRTREIVDGVDIALSGPHRIEDRVRGIRLGVPEGRDYPAVPPQRGRLGNVADPIRFGRSQIISFSPLGTASSGTLLLTDDRHELLAVVLFGPTVRVRVWRFEDRVGRWSL